MGRNNVLLTPRGVARGLLGVIASSFLVIVIAVSCAGYATTLTIQQTLFDLQTRYTTAGAIARHYVQLPRCRSIITGEIVVFTGPCSDERAVRAIQLVDQEVYSVLLAAEAARDTVDAALYVQLTQAALNRLRAVVARYAIKEALQ